jgi:uncharacterized membrane protein
MIWLRAALGVLYGGAGVLHLLHPAPFIAIVPPWVPSPAFVVWLTGWLEIAGAIGLQVPALRKAAGLGLAAYAIAVFPANIHHAMAGMEVGWLPASWWYHGPRLAAQPLLVMAALAAGGVWRLTRSPISPSGDR